MTKSFLIFAAVLILIGAILGGTLGRTPLTSSATGVISQQSIAEDYSEAVNLIDSKYVTSVEREKMLESSSQGMLWTLDPHSSFFTKDEFKKLYEDQASRFYGIGVTILQHRNGTYVQSIVPGTPAEKAGLKYGDRFVEIEGKDAKEYTSQEVSKNVRGERGTPVKIKMERVGNDKPLEFEIIRDGVPLPSIRNHFMLNAEVGYIGLVGGFQETTSEELDEATNELKMLGMKKLILDLRGNPGGLLPQAIEVSSRYLERGQVVVSVKGRGQNTKSKDYRAIGGGDKQTPMVVLINGGSASASEIVAGAIQDYARGILVGSDSFGKGLVQKVFPMQGGTGLTLTIQRYYTPFGRSLQRDYSNGSIYDYYTNQKDEPTPSPTAEQEKPKVPEIETASGRMFKSGVGVEPDIKVSPLPFSLARYRINEAAFFFTRQLVSGKISGIESYRVEKQKFEGMLKPDDFQITDKIFEAFQEFIAKNKENALSVENVRAEVEYAKTRLREELATANYSSEAGQQVILEKDPQVLKAIEAMPEAMKLLQIAR
jgi:carboxyl-terminal processing protease